MIKSINSYTCVRMCADLLGVAPVFALLVAHRRRGPLVALEHPGVTRCAVLTLFIVTVAQPTSTQCGSLASVEE